MTERKAQDTLLGLPKEERARLACDRALEFLRDEARAGRVAGFSCTQRFGVTVEVSFTLRPNHVARPEFRNGRVR